jgi:hypothetical protein
MTIAQVLPLSNNRETNGMDDKVGTPDFRSAEAHAVSKDEVVMSLMGARGYRGPGANEGGKVGTIILNTFRNEFGSERRNATRRREEAVINWNVGVERRVG